MEDNRKTAEENNKVNNRNNGFNSSEEDKDQDIKSTPVYRKKRVIIPVFIFLILAGIGWYWYLGTKGYISTDDAFIDGDKATISSKMLGRVLKLTVGEGDSVKAGDVLVNLDVSELQAQEKQAQTAITSSAESISLSKVNMDRAQQDLERAKSQYENKIIPKEQYDHAQAAYNAALADYNISKTKVGTAKTQLGVIESQLKNGKIISPINGVVAKRWILEGDVVQPGQPILTINDMKSIWVTAQFEETKLHSIIPGDTVEISVDAYPDVKFTGRVEQIGSNTASQFSLIPPNNASGNFTKVTQRVPVKISITNHNSSTQLLPGMSAEVRVKEAGQR